MKNLLLFQSTDKFKQIVKDLLKDRNYILHFVSEVDDLKNLPDEQRLLALIYDIDNGVDKLESVLNQLHRTDFPPVILTGKSENIKNVDSNIYKSVYAFLEKPVEDSTLMHTLLDIESVLGHTYRDLIEQQSLFGVCIVQDDKFKFVNKKFIEIIGFSYEYLLHEINSLDIVAAHDREFVKKHYERIVREEDLNVNVSFTALHKDNNEIEIEVWSGKILYNGKPAVQSIVSDISEKREFQLKEKIYEFRMMHEQKLASIGQLATGIAHNLNTPISVILSNAELLQLKYSDSPELDKIIRQTDRMTGIINGLLTKSKQEQIQNPQELDINELVENELEFLNSNLEFKHNVEKEYKFASNLSEITGVYSDFSQSIMNILQNAIDAMYQKAVKKLTVKTAADKEFIYLSIKDTGCGIDEKDHAKLFDPFYSTKPSPMERKSDEPTGTGLGLSTVFNLLTPYGISIEIDSEPGEGTEIMFKIPLTLSNNFSG